MKQITTIGAFLALFLTACAPEPMPLPQIEIPFTGESVMGDIDGDEYRFFRYKTEGAAKSDAARVSRDGLEIDNKKMPWDGPVHFFYLRKRIVIYVGENPNTLGTIEQIFGRPFAGVAVEE